MLYWQIVNTFEQIYLFIFKHFKWLDQHIKYDNGIPSISTIKRVVSFINPKALENIIFCCIACKKEDKKYRYTTIDQIIADCDSLLSNWDNDHQQLIKQIHNRVLQDYQIFNLNKIKMRQYFYQH